MNEHRKHPVGTGSLVTLHLTFTDSNGEVRLTTFGEEPVRIEIGKGQLTPGLEQLLMGHVAGDRDEIQVTAADAFGEHDTERVQALPRSGFPPEMDLQPGLLIGFDTPPGEPAGLILELNDRHVLVDFNHPLAGETLSFRYHIIDVQPAAES